MAEVQVDQRVELGEAGQLVQLIAGQAQGLDVAQSGVSSFQDPQVVVRQIHMDQVVQMLWSHDRYRQMINCTSVGTSNCILSSSWVQFEITVK